MGEGRNDSISMSTSMHEKNSWRRREKGKVLRLATWVMAARIQETYFCSTRPIQVCIYSQAHTDIDYMLDGIIVSYEINAGILYPQQSSLYVPYSHT